MTLYLRHQELKNLFNRLDQYRNKRYLLALVSSIVLAASIGFVYYIGEQQEASADHLGVDHYGYSIMEYVHIGSGSESSYSIINDAYRDASQNKADFILRWEEGYNDVDMKITSPSGTSYFRTADVPQTIE